MLRLYIFFMLTCCYNVAYCENSALWGKNGELWNSDSRLPDFSCAGYRCGEEPIPMLPVTANVMQFGATGDGVTDDTAAFKKAIESTPSGVIVVPAGRYLITDIIAIDKPALVLRGAGHDQSILYFTKPLNDIYPNMGKTTGGQPTSNYSWSGGFVALGGRKENKSNTTTVKVAKRGDYWIQVPELGEYTKNTWVEIKLTDDEHKTLLSFVYSEDPGSITSAKKNTVLQVARIVEVDANQKRLRLDRPLRVDIRTAWQPELRVFRPFVTGSGIEQLGFEFPATPYKGHFTELGFNAINIANCTQCWVRDISIRNAEGGIFLSASQCTVSNVVFTSAKEPIADGCRGHHGICVSGSDNRVEGFDFQVSYIHDLTVTGSSCAGNVFINGKGCDLNFDHHEQGNHANLFSNLDCGLGSRMWNSGGGGDLGRHCGGWGTFWNLRASQLLKPAELDWGPATINMVGLRTNQPTKTEFLGRWFEAIPPDTLVPQELHAAQLERRLAHKLEK